MRKNFLVLALILVVTACGEPGVIGGTDQPSTTTTIDPDQPVDSDGDEPIAEPGPVGSIPEPRPPIDGSVDGEVWVTSADLRIMESFPIQVMLDVEGEKPTPCHEIFWTVEDTGEAIEIDMISQVAGDQACAQVIEDFIIAVPLGSWAEETRDVYLNGQQVGSFES
ncbi:MAG: hypothetical protein M3N43_01830 [Actinomycetota bacterium]|nr:hypothetical protein [Actinomycetota bacterium]